MIRKFALALLAACGVALPGAAVAMPEADCAARWKSADGNGDGGALVKSGVPEREAEVYCEAVRRGGTMVSVRTSDDRTGYVRQIMDRHQPIDPVARRRLCAGEGWKRFDPSAAPYRPSQAEIDRVRRP